MADQALEFKDFSGGMTDNFVGAAVNKFERADNLVIRQDGKLESRFGCTVIDADYYQVPFTSTEKRVDSMFKFKDARFYQTMGKLYRINAGWSEIQGPGSTSLFSSSVSQFNQNSWAEWNNHMVITNDLRVRPSFLYKDSTTFYLRTLGLPKVTNAEVGSIGFSAGGAASRSYVFVRAHTYSINGVEFTQRSAVSLEKAYTGAITNSITGLPVLTNGTNEHYETTTIKLEIYRTIDTGTVYYKAGEVTNGTTTFSDTISDANLVLEDILYLEQDDLDYDQPPECKYVVQNSGVMYFLNIKDSRADIYPNRIVQANPDQISAAPEANTVDVDGDLTGGGVAAGNTVVFTANRTYRLQGIYDSTGNGGVQAIEISRTVGCVSHKSIVQTQDGVFFAARDGFYFTNGYNVLRISEEIPQTYALLVSTEAQAKRIYGTYDPYAKQLQWAVTSASDVTDNDQIFVAYLSFGIKPDTPFTRWTAGIDDWSGNFKPTALLYDEDENFLIRGDSRGYLFKQIDDFLDDLKIDTAEAPADWTTYPVIYDYRGPATDCGSVTNRKWGTKLVVYATSIGRVTMMPSSNNDNTGTFQEMSEIRSNSPVLWGDEDVVWGDPTIRWNYQPISAGLRRFPKRSARFSYKQIRLSNAYTLIQDSVEFGAAVIDGSADTATLSGSGNTWSADAVDLFLSTSADNYTEEWRVAERTSSTVITLANASNTLPTGTLSWKLRGYRRRESIRLLSYSIIFQMISPSQSPYRGS